MNAPSLMSLSAQQLRQAAALKDRIEALQSELSRLVGVTSSAPAYAANSVRRKISAAGIAHIRAAQRARWAKFKATQPKPAAPKPKRRISAAGRAKLAALARERWKKVKAQGRSAL